MDVNFPACLKVILKEEGGNDDDPNDHGGRTSRGITAGEWDIWRKTHPNLPEDVWKAPQDEITAIYREQYWKPYCPDLPTGLDLEFFDCSVNAGRQQAVKTLQRALGINADGMFGIATKQAIQDANIDKTIALFSQKRREFYQSLAQFPTFGKDWIARTNRVETTASAMAHNQPTIHPTIDTLPAQPEVTVSPKADPTDTVKTTVSANTASAGTIIGSVGGAISDQLNQVSTAIQPLAETFAIAKYVCIGITIICACLAIYAVIHKQRIEAVVA